MSVVVEVSVPAESFALADALAAEPDVAVEAERVASHSPEWILPFLWAADGDRESFLEAIRRDPTVENVIVIERADGDVLYGVEWSDSVRELITEMIDQHAIILEATARGADWRLRLRFTTEAEVTSFREYFEERGRRFEVHMIARPDAPRQREYGLTEEQHETLMTALREGYFDVPRTVTIEELADVLGVSSNAVSQRLRRATTNLVRHTLAIETDESDGRE
ncbi:helix-turn-helix domain-containing protein [Halorarum salinum]|uniref:Helix-turn-helix domain-containing protein n=1 Tax=Halorarum salinum TaxID=2743089 RepID=A0A7D5QJM6_9EURY|nr:helix-turn-helix domain-containing protein [Halobaculum salinum]QLG61525.1 helix-turn-helix domain-containing protein [Halobaculum salinum]